MKTHLSKTLILSLVLLLVPIMEGPIASAADKADLEDLVERSRMTLDNFLDDPNMGWFRDHIDEADGILIVPVTWKGAFFFGGEWARGVFLVRDDKTGQWSEPAFYSMGTASGGFQFGVQRSEIVLLAMSSRGVESMLSSTFKLGADVSVAVGPVGAGIEGSTAVLSVDMITFARTKGLFGGISLEAAVIDTWDESNQEYYGKAVRATDILVKQTVTNPQSAGLRAALNDAVKGHAPADQTATQAPN